MNRRGFISLLAGAAGAPLVPWRGLVEPLIVLPARERSMYGRAPWWMDQNIIRALDMDRVRAAYLDAIGRQMGREIDLVVWGNISVERRFLGD